MESLVDRLDARLDAFAGHPGQETPSLRASESYASTDRDTAPVLLIRDVAPRATESTIPASQSDVISKGLVTLPTARSLLELYDCLPLAIVCTC